MNNNCEYSLCDAIDVIEEVLENDGEFKLSPKGTSMLPLIRQGRDSVVLKRNFEKGALKHDIAFYKRASGAFVLHRVMKIAKDGTYVMCGDNQTSLEFGIKREQIIGYVSGVYRDGKYLSAKSFRYRAYVFFWCIMPFRKLCRYCAAVKRRIFRKKPKK